MQYISKYQSPLGKITIAVCENYLTGLWFDGQKYFASTLPIEFKEKKLPIFEQTKEWLECYFSGRIPDFLPALRLEGTPFRLAVWEILRGIPYGEVITYKDIAKEIEGKIGRKMSAQAVGGAVGHNPVSIIVPCHRVVSCNGSLTGYAGGIARKLSLLTLEGADVTKFFIPAQGTAL